MEKFFLAFLLLFIFGYLVYLNLFVSSSLTIPYDRIALASVSLPSYFVVSGLGILLMEVVFILFYLFLKKKLKFTDYFLMGLLILYSVPFLIFLNKPVRVINSILLFLLNIWLLIRLNCQKFQKDCLSLFDLNKNFFGLKNIFIMPILTVDNFLSFCFSKIKRIKILEKIQSLFDLNFEGKFQFLNKQNIISNFINLFFTKIFGCCICKNIFYKNKFL